MNIKKKKKRWSSPFRTTITSSRKETEVQKKEKMYGKSHVTSKRDGVGHPYMTGLMAVFSPIFMDTNVVSTCFPCNLFF